MGLKEGEKKQCLFGTRAVKDRSRRLGFEMRGGNRCAFNFSYTCVRIRSMVPALTRPTLLAVTIVKRNAKATGGSPLQQAAVPLRRAKTQEKRNARRRYTPSSRT